MTCTPAGGITVAIGYGTCGGLIGLTATTSFPADFTFTVPYLPGFLYVQVYTAFFPVSCDWTVKLSDYSTEGLNVTGIIIAYGGSAAPAGFLLCDGSAVSRTTYADLFAALGTTWGAGDGSTTFNLPDLRGRSALGAGTGSGLTPRSLRRQRRRRNAFARHW